MPFSRDCDIRLFFRGKTYFHKEQRHSESVKIKKFSVSAVIFHYISEYHTAIMRHNNMMQQNAKRHIQIWQSGHKTKKVRLSLRTGGLPDIR